MLNAVETLSILKLRQFQKVYHCTRQFLHVLAHCNIFTTVNNHQTFQHVLTFFSTFQHFLVLFSTFQPFLAKPAMTHLQHFLAHFNNCPFIIWLYVFLALISAFQQMESGRLEFLEYFSLFQHFLAQPTHHGHFLALSSIFQHFLAQRIKDETH